MLVALVHYCVLWDCESLTHVNLILFFTIPVWRPHFLLNGIKKYLTEWVNLMSVTVFNFTRPPILSALLLILSASRFLTPDSPLLVPAPFLFSVHQHGMTFPFLSNRNPLWTHSNLIWKFSFSQNCRPAVFSVPCWCLYPFQVSRAFAARFYAVSI